MRELESVGLMILALLALHILQASSEAKNAAFVMRHQITRADQELGACRARQ